MKLQARDGFALLLALAVAAAIAVVLVNSRVPLEHVAVEMPRRAVEALVVREIDFRSRITAYGNVEPAITLDSMAEVSGKISYVHPNLKSGETIPAGTLVVSIEAEDYELSLQQTREDLKASRSALAELEAEVKSTRRSLELARENLVVGEAELARIRDVYRQQLIAKSTLDAEEQKVIQLRQQVEDLQGRIDSQASRRQSIEAQIARAEQEVQNRATILGRTGTTLPFDARIGSVSIDENEFVTVGSPLFEAIDLRGVEISAQLPLVSMRQLISHLEDREVALQQFVQTGGRINESLGLSARVRLVNGMPEAVWDARVLRISEAIDETRQTLGVVVGVDDPYEKIIPGRRPPLLKGMYTAVDLFAPQRSALVIPRRALHEGRVYLADADDRLEIRAVDVQLTQGELAVIRGGLEIGERVIVNDLVPVIAGMPLEVNLVAGIEEDLRRRALGEI
ncbi:MAG TPA: HlyD family secretion protein [Gammaproteobacteria bacterium]